MKLFKYTIWIIVMFLIQTVVLGHILPFGIHTDIILPFVAAVAIRERTFKVSMTVSVACAVLAGALCGKNFSFCVLFYTYLGAVVFGTRKYYVYMPERIKYMLWVIAALLLSEFLSFWLLYGFTNWIWTAVVSKILPSVICSVIIAALIYPAADMLLFCEEN